MKIDIKTKIRITKLRRVVKYEQIKCYALNRIIKMQEERMKAFIFDLDGVIVFTDRFHYQAWKAMADNMGIYFDKKINNRLRGVSRAESLEIILERYTGEPLSQAKKEALMNEKNDIYRKLLSAMTPADVDEEVRETLRKLRINGHKLAIGSSSKNTKYILEKVGLGDYFDAVSDGNNISHSKPDPEVFLKACEFLNEKPENCIVVEDAHAGIKAAKAVGMTAVGIGDAASCKETDYSIHSFKELLKIQGEESMNLQGKPFYLNEDQIKWVRNTLAEMTTTQKIGQLFCVLGDANTPEGLRELVKDYGIGGVLFRPDALEKIQKKYSDLDEFAKVPLLKAANLEEGGAGVLTDGTYYGSQMEVAATDDLNCTRKFARVCAAEGRKAGVNWTFSPVVDIDYNFRNPITNVRTFGSNPEKVLSNASAFVEEIQKYGIAASCKHFPGDGVDFRDQHLHPTYNDLSADAWFDTYGKIYETLIQQGLLSIMVGHIVQPNVIQKINPQVEEKEALPASLSKEMLTGVLRERFGFNGVIITDATIMGGYTMAMPRKEAIPTSIQAGCDMICFSTDIYEDIQYVKDGLQNKILSEERLNEAVTRILALKAKVAMNQLKNSADEISFKECQKWSKECADKGITLVKDTQNLIPVKKENYPKIRLVLVGNDEMFDGSLTKIAEEILTENGFQVEKYDPFADDLHGCNNLPEDRLTLILANYQTASNNTTVRISWCPKHALEIPRFVNEEKTAFISFANPYHLQDIPRVRTYVNSYAANRVTVCQAIEKLIGKSSFNGVSPVDAFCGLRDTHY